METSNISTLHHQGDPGESAGRASRRALVILGMHRSGTSAVAGCLQRLGVEFGPRLMPATAANQKGYYEHIDVVNLHDRLLTALGRGWDSTAPWPEQWWEGALPTGRFREELLAVLLRDFRDAPLWGIKDPRLCHLLPWWRPLWQMLDTEPVYLIVVRDPREVAASLRKRDGISLVKSYVLWLQHMVGAETQTRGCERYFLGAAQFFSDWMTALEPLAGSLGPAWRNILAEGKETNRGFLDGTLRRSASATDQKQIPLEVQAVADWFAARNGSSDKDAVVALDYYPSALWADKILGDQLGSEAQADLKIELSNARRLAAWYESEWHKANGRATKYKARAEQTKGWGKDQIPK